MNRKWILLAFLLVALAQLYVPAKMILDREDILKTGVEYRFKTAPLDPNDPFRGKYITLSFDNNTVPLTDSLTYSWGDEVYVHLGTDADGFASPIAASKAPPAGDRDYLKAKVNYVDSDRMLSIDFPFDRFYMEESKSYDAEQLHRQMQLDSGNTTYALVRVKNGQGVLKDVMINGVSISDLVATDERAE